MGIGGSLLSILSRLPSKQSQHVMVDGCQSLVNVVSGVTQDTVLGSLLCLLYTSEHFPFWKTSWSVIPWLSSGVRVTVAESLSRDLGRVSEGCGLLWMKLNASKTKTTMVSRSSTPINYYRNCAEGVWWPWYSGSDIWFQLMTFENHRRSVSRAASQRLGIVRKSWRVFYDRSLLEKCLRGLVILFQ